MARAWREAVAGAFVGMVTLGVALGTRLAIPPQAAARAAAPSLAAPAQPLPGMIPGEPWYRTQAQAFAEAQQLLGAIPVYPGAMRLTAGPYQARTASTRTTSVSA